MITLLQHSNMHCSVTGRHCSKVIHHPMVTAMAIVYYALLIKFKALRINTPFFAYDIRIQTSGRLLASCGIRREYNNKRRVVKFDAENRNNTKKN